MKNMENDKLYEALRIVVENYIDSGKSEGSRKIVRKYHLSISPATLRNMLFDLQEMGYLTSLHTSGGKLPTAKGYKYYADRIVHSSSPEGSIVPVFVNSSDSLKTVMAKISSWLSEKSNYLVAITKPDVTSLKLKKIDLIRLDKTKVYLIFILEYGWMDSEIFKINKNDFGYLKEVVEDLNRKYKNFPINDIKDRLINDIRCNKRRCDELYTSLINLYDKLYKNKDGVAISGMDNLLEMEKFNKNANFLKSFVELLEKKELISNILDKTINGSDSQIFIGKDNLIDLPENASVITSSYNVKDNVGLISIMGPLNMNYKKGLRLVRQAAIQLKWFEMRYEEEM